MSIMDDFPNAGYARRVGGSAPGRLNGAPGGPPCPTCGSRNSAVIDSRKIEGGQKRRRKCMERESCPRWNTYETNIDPESLKAPEISKLDQSRIIRLAEVAAALKKSLKIED